MTRGRNDFFWEFDPFNIDSIEKMASLDFAGAVDRGIKSGLRQVAERTAVRIKERLVAYGLGDSHIADNITVEILDRGISIKLNDDNYLFVEYGTGIVGENNTPHPFTKSGHNVGWTYDTNSHGDTGWWYPTVPVDPNPTTKRSADGGWIAWTKGQRARPFMYEGWLYASKATVVTVNNHIVKELKKLEGVM